MNTIIHTCNSILIRPNGIVRYINAVMDLQRAAGNKIVFVTDEMPTQDIHADEIYFRSGYPVSYIPNMKDGHVWLQYEESLTNDLEIQLILHADYTAKLIVAHDLHSFNAASRIYKDGIFVQHESDILTLDSRYSFMDDDYLARQADAVENTTWRIGMTVKSKYIHPKRPVYTPAPIVLEPAYNGPKTKDLLYIGDATERKGAKEFMEMARSLKVTPTVITHEVDNELFAGADVYSFPLAKRDEMMELIRQHKVAYIPSKNECPGLAVLECLQYMPVIVDGKYVWTDYLRNTGATIVEGDAIKNSIAYYLEYYSLLEAEYDRTLLENWTANAKDLWLNLSA